MASLNKVMLIGNLTRDVELSYTKSGAAVAKMGLAINSKYKTKEGEWKEEVCFVNLTAWGRTAETASEYLSKGSPVLVEGRLKFDQWEDKEGNKRSALSVVVERLQFLSYNKSKPEESSDGSGADKSPPSAPDSSSTDKPAIGGLDPDIPF